MYVNAPRYLLRKFCVMKLIQNVRRGKALDIGCGAGDLCETLAGKGFNVKGIDFSPEAIMLCQERVKKNEPLKQKLTFQCADLFDLRETFDLIIMCEVLEHVEQDKKFLEKIFQLLNPGGTLILSVPAHKEWFGPSDREVGHYRRYDKNELIHLLNEKSFNTLKIWSYGVPLANITELIRSMIDSKRQHKDKIEGTKKSGIDRTIEARFRFFLNDLFLYPFYLLQFLFISTDMGTGYIVKAIKRD